MTVGDIRRAVVESRVVWAGRDAFEEWLTANLFWFLCTNPSEEIAKKKIVAFLVVVDGVVMEQRGGDLS